MNRELPKPIQEALARQAAGDVHPSADALTAFVEHSLPQRESQGITDHLARCGDCREVVFLASNAVEEQKLVAAAAPIEASPRRKGRLWWLWVPAVAAVLVVSGVVLQSRFMQRRSAPMEVAVKAPPPGPTHAPETAPLARATESAGQPAVEYKTTAESHKTDGKLGRARADQRQSAGSVKESVIARNAPEEYPPAPGAIPKSLSASPADALGFANPPPAAVPTHNAFVESEGQSTSGFLPGAHPQMAMRSVSAPRFQWRVTPGGHLERSTAPGSWTPVLADQPATFRVVSVVGNNMWAGGSGGALFHSSDGGQNWSKQPLAAETGAVVSIRFSDAANGLVTTDAGSRWSTSDGGVTWTKQ
jgi:hypothetical protein